MELFLAVIIGLTVTKEVDHRSSGATLVVFTTRTRVLSRRTMAMIFVMTLSMRVNHDGLSSGVLLSMSSGHCDTALTLTHRNVMQMLLLESVGDDFTQKLPLVTVDHLPSATNLLGVGLGSVIPNSHWRSLLIFITYDASHEFFGLTITIVVTVLTEDVESSEQVLSHIETRNANEQGNIVENAGRIFINWVSLQGYMVHVFSFVGGLLELPDHLRLLGMGMVLPLVLPPGELFFSKSNHLLEPLDLVTLSLEGVIHLSEDSVVVLLLSEDFTSLLSNLVDL